MLASCYRSVFFFLYSWSLSENRFLALTVLEEREVARMSPQDAMKRRKSENSLCVCAERDGCWGCTRQERGNGKEGQNWFERSSFWNKVRYWWASNGSIKREIPNNNNGDSKIERRWSEMYCESSRTRVKLCACGFYSICAVLCVCLSVQLHTTLIAHFSCRLFSLSLLLSTSLFTTTFNTS